MKLIVAEAGAWRGYVSREYFYVMRELVENCGWRLIETSRLWHSTRELKETLLEVFGELPETILFWESYHLFRGRTREVLELDCRKCVFADDLHWRDEGVRQSKQHAYSMCDTILSSYAYVFGSFFPDIAGAKEVVWVPHAASPDFMLPFNERPVNAVLLSGAVNHYYPLRLQ
ncbi:MAG TPA: hypothetical protein VF754_06350, partial [Pyrinomonadaceae bacterium]